MSMPLNPSQYQYQYIQQFDSPTHITMGSQTTQPGFSEYSLDGSPTSVSATVGAHGHNGNLGYGDVHGYNGNLGNLVSGCMESPNGNLGSGVANSHGEFSSNGIGDVNGNLGSGGAYSNGEYGFGGYSNGESSFGGTGGVNGNLGLGGAYSHGDLISGGAGGLNANLGSAGAYFNQGNFASGRMSDVGRVGVDGHVGNLGLRSTYGENVNACSGDVLDLGYVSGDSGYHSNVSDKDKEDNDDLENGLGYPEEDNRVVTPIYILYKVYLQRVHTDPQAPAKSTLLVPEGKPTTWLTNITGWKLKCFKKGAGAALSRRPKLQDCQIDNEARNTLTWTVWIMGDTVYPKVHPVTLDTNLKFEQSKQAKEGQGNGMFFSLLTCVQQLSTMGVLAIAKKAISKMAKPLLNQYISTQAATFYCDTPKTLQVESVSALAKGKNVFVRAATGYGKTRISKMFFNLFKDSKVVVLVLDPLDSLGDDQARGKSTDEHHCNQFE
ncbi:hypothetical protein PSHT_02416 [Puccinia striiformis]|uniref:Uncharacterized protein n=2 Tax=Puccinia striiformis TaxID=27350 RepID=A0A2S4WHZ6_9BASI|nr:hypothetical protein PSTT_06497 [Puccinia striiformis]POW21371.1 hypothetical protein PSHT_02416 [Puccinia striiformis]